MSKESKAPLLAAVAGKLYWVVVGVWVVGVAVATIAVL